MNFRIYPYRIIILIIGSFGLLSCSSSSPKDINARNCLNNKLISFDNHASNFITDMYLEKESKYEVDYYEDFDLENQKRDTILASSIFIYKSAIIIQGDNLIIAYRCGMNGTETQKYTSVIYKMKGLNAGELLPNYLLYNSENGSIRFVDYYEYSSKYELTENEFKLSTVPIIYENELIDTLIYRGISCKDGGLQSAL